MGTQQPQRIIVVERKSIGLALLLTFLFGPLGMLYSTVVGALIMLVISAIVAALTFGVGLIFTWPVCMLWGCVAASRTKSQVMR